MFYKRYPIHTLWIPYPKKKKKRYPMDTTVTVTDTVSDTDTDISTNSSKSSTDQSYQFDTFWYEYPRKESKAKTKTWFEKNKPSDELMKKILAALTKAKATRQWQDKNFIPHPITWLNQRRWEDEVIVSNTKKEKALPAWYEKYQEQLAAQVAMQNEETLSNAEIEAILKMAKEKYN